MIHLVTSANRARYADQIEQMFRLRHDFYVVERGWRDLDRGDGREVDEYDDEEAIYLLHLDDAGDVDGSYRICPTVRRSLLADRFAHLVEGEEIPSGPKIYEITRFFLSPQARRMVGTARSAVSAELTTGLIEVAVRRGLTHYTLVCDTFFLPRLQALHWPFIHLGLPHDYNEGTAMAVLIETGPEVLARTREVMGLRHPVTFEAGPVLGSDDYSVSPQMEADALKRLAPVRQPHLQSESGTRPETHARKQRGEQIVVDVMTAPHG